MSELLEVRQVNPVYTGSLRSMPVGQLFYMQKGLRDYRMDFLCEFVEIDQRGYVVGNVVANHSAHHFLRTREVGFEVKARANNCYLFIAHNTPSPCCNWFPSLDMPAIGK